MSSLRLFDLAPAEERSEDRVARLRAVPEVDLGPSEDSLHASELYLAEHIERHGDLARIQAVLFLCDGPASPARAFDELEVDERRFPRSAEAISRVRSAMDKPAEEQPGGFWPRFLLEALAA